MKQLLLLHGAVGSKEQLQPLSQALSNNFQLHVINFSGHGGSEGGSEFSIQHFANDVVHWLKENSIEKVSIFGYSMGGYVALFLARFYPALVESVVTLGTKWHWDESTAIKEIAMLDPETIEQKVPKFAAQLAQRHHPSDWKTVLRKTADMLRRMGSAPPLTPDDYQQINCSVLLLLGDRDKMVTLDETVAVFRQLTAAQLGVLPNLSHPIEAVDIEQLTGLVKKFMQ